jgi:hypothetical protein
LCYEYLIHAGQHSQKETPTSGSGDSNSFPSFGLLPRKKRSKVTDTRMSKLPVSIVLVHQQDITLQVRGDICSTPQTRSSPSNNPYMPPTMVGLFAGRQMNGGSSRTSTPYGGERMEGGTGSPDENLSDNMSDMNMSSQDVHHYK